MLKSLIPLILFLALTANGEPIAELNFLSFDKGLNAEVTELIELIEETSLYEIEKEKLREEIIGGIVKSIDDNYSGVETKNSSVVDYVNGNYGGFGFDIDLDKEGNFVVSNILSGGNAKKQGLMVGDRIISINEIPLMGNNKLYEAATDLIEDGKEHNFEIIRNDEKININIKREPYREPSIESKTIDGDIYYIDINNFSVDVFDEFAREIEEIEEFKFEKVLIDLRHNPGGSIQAAVDCASLICNNSPLGYTKRKDGIIKLEPSKNLKKIRDLNLSIVILVSKDTASAAELFADILREDLGAIIIGEKTYGKWLSQEVFNVGDLEVRFTTGVFSARKDFDLKKEGLEPDYIVEEKYPVPYRDTILKKALVLLK